MISCQWARERSVVIYRNNISIQYFSVQGIAKITYKLAASQIKTHYELVDLLFYLHVQNRDVRVNEVKMKACGLSLL